MCEEDDDVTEALGDIGATQTKPMDEKKWGWMPTLYKDGYCSHRTKMVTVEATEYVLACASAADRHSWIMVRMKNNGKHTRIKLVVPGRSPSYWQVPTRTGAPVSPTPTFPRLDFPTERTRMAWHRQAWEDQFPQLQKKPPQAEPRGMAARMDEVEKLLKQLLAQRQPPATAAATPVVPVPTVEFLKRIQDLETDKAKMAEQLAEVRALVEKQDQVAAAQQASYERCKRTLVEGRLEDEETMRKQRTEITS